MHILTTTSASLDDLIEPVDLQQQPADVVALSFTDSDLAGIAAAWRGDPTLPSLRLAALRDLRHPMSVDLWVDSVARHAKVILVRLLGGYDWWRYGCDQLAAVAGAHCVKLALLPGEDRADDPRLTEASTLPRKELDALLAFFREGGPDNMRGLAEKLAGLARGETIETDARPVPKAGFYSFRTAQQLISPLEGEMPGRAEGGHSILAIPILFYRSMLLASDAAPIDALCEALAAR
ncbi:cobaltochelatase subunit CobN, partial [Escherichia coli]|nr:cobaltochelatase subunit CobN [Escherichia coli]